MPAPQADRLASDTRGAAVSALGIVAGGGALPDILVRSCERRKIHPFIIAMKGFTDPALLRGRDHMIARPGAAGSILRQIRERNIRDLVLIGSLSRPGIVSLWPDLRTILFFLKIGMRKRGDNKLLTAIRAELEEEGFALHGIHAFVDDLMMPEGKIGSVEPDEEDLRDIRIGFMAAQAHGLLDLGQAVIVSDGAVLGKEDKKGTDALIRRCVRGKEARGRGVLVKTCKPQQDRDLDLPAIGPQTVMLCAQAGLKGIAVESGAALLVEPDRVRELADRHNLFVVGVKA